MNLDINKLCIDVGLKYNDSVILGKEEVTKFIKKHPAKFNELYLNAIDNSQMLYGYNSEQNPIKIGYKNDLIQRIIIVAKPIKYTRYKAIISYDGHLYNGFQIQKNHKTIQGELSKVVSNINDYETLVQGASRTDTGVHAYHYVIHFDSIRGISSDRWVQLLNYHLPSDILVKEVTQTHPLFHSRYDVYKKRYLYKIRLNDLNPFRTNYEWDCKNLDLEILKNNLEQLVGEHDFTSFCKGEPKDTIRIIYKAEFQETEDGINLIFEGNGFLRYMIRIIVYTLYLQSTNKLTLSITDILKEKSRNHTKDLAPASGLYLDKIFY